MSATVVAGCNGPPVLLSGKKILDCVAHSIRPLVVMDWFLAAATGQDARRDALPGQHLADFVAVIPLIPHHRSSRRQVFVYPISTSEVTVFPFSQVQPQRTTFPVANPMSLLVMPPLVRPIRGGQTPLLRLDALGWALRSVASILSTSGSAGSGGSTASDADNSEKIRSQYPCPTSGGSGCRGFCGDHRPPGHPPSSDRSGSRR